MTPDSLEAVLAAAERAAERQHRWELVHATAFAFQFVPILFSVVALSATSTSAWSAGWTNYAIAFAATVVPYLVARRVIWKSARMVACEGKAHHALGDHARALASLEPSQGLVAYRLSCLELGFRHSALPWIDVIIFGHPVNG